MLATPILATSDESERLSASLLQALSISGYVKPGTDAAVEDRVRRLVRRMRMTSEDTDIMQGMVKQILWKLKAYIGCGTPWGGGEPLSLQSQIPTDVVILMFRLKPLVTLPCGAHQFNSRAPRPHGLGYIISRLRHLAHETRFLPGIELQSGKG